MGGRREASVVTGASPYVIPFFPVFFWTGPPQNVEEMQNTLVLLFGSRRSDGNEGLKGTLALRQAQFYHAAYYPLRVPEVVDMLLLTTQQYI